MTESAGTPQNTELDPESPTGETTADVIQEAGEEGVAVDYQTRMEEFDQVDTSVPVTSLPTESRNLDPSDLEINP